NTIANFPGGAGIQVIGGNANTGGGPAGTVGSMTITGNSISGNSTGNLMGTDAIAIAIDGGNSGSRSSGTFVISNNGTVANPLANTAGAVILVACNGFTDCTITTNNNVISGHTTSASPGISGGTGVTVGTGDTAVMGWTIIGNNISNTDGNGILAVARGATGTLNAKIQNNNVAAPLSGVREGIRID